MSKKSQVNEMFVDNLCVGVSELSAWNRAQKRISDIMQMLARDQAPASSGLKALQSRQSPYGLSSRKGSYETSLLKRESKNSPFSHQLQTLIKQESKRQQVSPDLVQALVKVESGGRYTARSPKGALGLMQLMPGTARALGVNPLDPQENLSGGIRYLKAMARRFGDLDLALAAYNAGPQAVKKYGGVPPYKETLQYIQKIRAQL